MTVFYIISSRQKYNTGKGGSYFSSASIAKTLSERHEVYFFVVGDQNSPVIEEMLHKRHFHLKMGGINNLLSIMKYVWMTIKLKPDVIHIYDLVVIFFGYISQILSGSKIVMTQPGGANRTISSGYFPKNIITCSEENYDFFVKLKACEFVENIPNRIIPFQTNYSLLGFLKRRINFTPDDLIIIKLGRMHDYYSLGIDQAYDFYINLKNKTNKAKLIYLGHQDENYILPAKFVVDPNVYLINDAILTKDAKSVIGFADYLIANGRGAMEGFHTGNKVLVPTKKHGLIVVNRNNLNNVIKYNFSERILLEENQLPININQSEPNEFYRNVFDKYFNVLTGAKQIELFYSKAIKDYPKPMNMLKAFGSLFINF